MPQEAMSGWKQSVRWSAMIHAMGIVALVGIWWISKSGIVDFAEVVVIDAPQVSTAAKTIAPQKIEQPKQETRAREVFGVSRRSLLNEDTNDSSKDAVAIKAGNTVAKAPDALALKASDEDAIPIPADEFMVTAMPKLKSEIRVPYPPEAKAKGIQGVVVLELLIDSKGRVRETKILQGPGAGLNEAAASAAARFEFEPAFIDQQSVAVRIRYAYRFVLEK